MFKFENDHVTFSKDIFWGACIILFILMIFFILSLLKPSSTDPSGSPNSPTSPEQSDLLKALDQKQFPVLILPNAKGEIEVLTPNGEPVPECGIKKGAEMPKECELNGEMKTFISVNVGILKENPKCMWIDVGGRIRKVHVGGDVDKEGRPYKKGWRRCHGKKATSPPHKY